MMNLDEAIAYFDGSAFKTGTRLLDAWQVIRAHLSQPQPVAQGEAVAFRIVGKHGPHSWREIDERAKDFVLSEGERLEYAYAAPTIPTGHKVVPVEPTTTDVNECGACSGLGKVCIYTGEWETCGSCDGSGRNALAASPSAGGV